jgi:hypothetical protein
MKNSLREGHSIDLEQLGKLRTVKLSRRRRVSRVLKNVGTSVFDYSKHAQTVKLNSRHDLSYEPLPTIVHPAPPKPKFTKRPCAIAYPRWRDATRVARSRNCIGSASNGKALSFSEHSPFGLDF